MRPMRRALIGFLIGIILTGETAFAADLLVKEGKGIERKSPEPSEQEGSKNVEQLLMEGTEIQGTLEKPHVVYVIPWKELSSSVEEGTPLRRSFRNEILEPVDREQFQNQWGSLSRRPK
ncbi:MAG TPA: hypothetical protein VFH55_12675 [Nitrospiria bacterium]|nr:hypothetical protein [Nitrospiria bacterium]